MHYDLTIESPSGTRAHITVEASDSEEAQDKALTTHKGWRITNLDLQRQAPLALRQAAAAREARLFGTDPSWFGV